MNDPNAPDVPAVGTEALLRALVGEYGVSAKTSQTIVGRSWVAIGR